MDGNWLKHVVPILDTYIDSSRESQNNSQDIVTQDDICTQVSMKRKLNNEDLDRRVKKLRDDANISLEEDSNAQLLPNSSSDKVINDANSQAINELVQDLLLDIDSMIHSNIVNYIGDITG